MKLDYQKMRIALTHASSDTEMRDPAIRDTERMWLNGEWYKGSNYETTFERRPKPEMNKLFGAIMSVIGDVNDMEFAAEITPYSNDADDKGAQLLENKWRHDYLSTDGVEASENATMEAAVCGFGATEQVIKYIDEENPRDDERYVCHEIVESAVCSVFFNAGARRRDRSDATKGWRFIRVNREETAEEFGREITSLHPGDSYYDGATRLDYQTQRDVFIVKYWELVKRTVKTYDFEMISGMKLVHTVGDGYKLVDMMGGERKATKEDLNELQQVFEQATGQQAEPEVKKVNQCYFSYADGEGWLGKTYKRPWKRIPLYPRFWHYATIKGQEVWFGELRKKTDLEMFHNVAASQLMEAMMDRAIPLEEYTPEQVARFKNQIDSELVDRPAYRLTDPVKDANDNPIHFGPTSILPAAAPSQAVLSGIDFLDKNIMEANGTGQTKAPSNTSNEAIEQVNDRADRRYIMPVKCITHAMRAECRGYIDAAQEVYFSNPTMISVTMIDGSEERIQTLEMTDMPDGSYGAYGNNPRGKYNVKVKKGEAYKDQTQKEIEDNNNQLQYSGTETPAGQILMYRNMELLNTQKNAKIQSIAKYAQLDVIIQSGYPYEPQDEDEAQYIQMKTQQLQEQNAMMQQQAEMQNQALMNAQLQAVVKESEARDKEGQAAIMNEINDANKLQIDMYKAETDRAKVDVEAQKAGAEIDIKQTEMMLKQQMAMFSNRQFA